MAYQELIVSNEDGLGIIRLNRPALMNAMSSRMRVEMLAAITELSASARVIVLTGEGRAFCSGQDLGDADAAAEPDLGRLLREEYEPILKAIAAAPVPVIAAVNGIAAGAGANLALAADIVIAAESAAFLQAFSKIGLIPDAGGTYWLPRLVGFQQAMGQALFAEKLPARAALAQGLIWEVFADEAFEAGWRGRAAQLAKGPTKAYGLIKKAIRASLANDFATQLAVEAELQGEAGASADFREGVQAFLEKRPARFEGK